MVRWLCRIYGLMLLAYPSDFRREYGREMTIVFRSRARSVVENEGRWALVTFALHITGDWIRTAFREDRNMAVRMPVLRWCAALPSAMLAAYAALRIVGFIAARDFHHLWTWTSLGFFSMAAAFVSVGVWVAPSRKDSVARIAVSVIVVFGAYAVALGVLNLARLPMLWGGCILLGGVAAYLPWRFLGPSGAA